jgi:hypothetical protein
MLPSCLAPTFGDAGADDHPPNEEVHNMIGRMATIALAGAVAVLGPVGAAIAVDETDDSDREAVVFKREDDDDEVQTPFTRGGDDDDTNTGNGGGTSFTSGVNSNDGTNSRVTSVSRDRDRSRGDLTRDRTKDGPGTKTRDRSRHRTNDRSKHDTR